MYDAVRARLDVDDLPGAVAAALEHWRRVRDPAVAAALEGLTEQALKQRRPRTGRTKEEFHAAWLALAADADAVDVGWLAKTLLERVPLKEERFGLLRPNWEQERYAPFFERLRLLVPHAPDPRVGRAMLEVFRRGYLTVWYDPDRLTALYQPVVDALVAAGDPHLADEVEALAAAPLARQQVARVAISAVLSPTTPRLREIRSAREPDPGPWLAHAPPARKPAPDVGELLAAVYEDPEDDEPRAVLADVLAEASDPRGEFVQLQLALASGADDEKVRKQAGGLFRQHKRAWVGATTSTACS